MRLIIPRRISDQLVNALREAGARETGGILMGEQIREGCFRIHEATVQSNAGTIGSFLRTPYQAATALSRFFDETGHDYLRFNYLGEWHSHPSLSLEPSLRDHATMWSIVHDITVGAGFAVLLILSLDSDMRLLTDASVYVRGLKPSKVIVLEEPRSYDRS